MNEKLVRDMFANLIAGGMNADTKKDAHPAFTQLIKEMIPLDALVLRKLKNPQVSFRIRLGSPTQWHELGITYSFAISDVNASLVSLSLNNLIRLGLVRETTNEWRNIPNLEDMEKQALASHGGFVQELQKLPEEFRKVVGVPDGSLFARRDGFILSKLGEAFLRICLP